MVRVSVMYPNANGVTFDMSYYTTKHIPMVQQKLGRALKGTAISKGLAGGAPGSAAPYVAMVELDFDSADAFRGAFGSHADAIIADIPNYTNAKPVIQISEIVR
jgi:uncharacterized protein (TIGR02118 family)